MSIPIMKVSSIHECAAGSSALGGRIVMWELSPSSSYYQVQRVVDVAGLSAIMPAPRSPQSALAAALAEVISPLEKKHRVMVRPVKGVDSKLLAIFDENPEVKGEGRFTPMNRASIVGEEGSEYIQYEQWVGDDIHKSVKEKWEHLRTTMSAAALGTLLAEAIMRMGGVPLRQRGGTYWLPAERCELWDAFAAGIESANECRSSDPLDGRESKIYGINIPVDDRMIECVGDAMSRDLSTRLKEMQDAMVNDDGVVQLRKATVEARLRQMEEMRRQTENFTGAFRRKLTELDGQFAVCEALLASYTLADSVATEIEQEKAENERLELMVA